MVLLTKARKLNLIMRIPQPNPQMKAVLQDNQSVISTIVKVTRDKGLRNCSRLKEAKDT